MRNVEEREQILNMYFHEGKGYKNIAKETGLSLDVVKALCRRYRVANNIPKRGETVLSNQPLKKESIHVINLRDKNNPEARITRLEMEVELLRNFLILTEEK